MIDRLQGIVLDKSATGIALDVGGVAFAIAVPFTSMEKIGPIGSKITIFTHLIIRDDNIELFGFYDRSQRKLFTKLIKISGVGPKTALAILSHFEASELADLVLREDAKRISIVPGIGRKTAERIIIDLRDRLKEALITSDSASGTISKISEAMSALEALGINPINASEAVKRAQQTLGKDATVEDLIKAALKMK